MHPSAIIPTRTYDSDAGFDLVATSMKQSVFIDVNERDGWETYKVNTIEYGTGVAVAIPTGYFGLLVPRSSVSTKHLMLANSCGIIDSGFTGEIKVVFKSVAPRQNYYNVGDRVTQLLILPIPDIEFEECNDLPSSERSEGGFGSTGV